MVGEGARGELELDLVGDDVALRAAMDGADGDDGGVLRVFLAADDGLQLGDEQGRQDDGVLALLGLGAVRADAADGDVHRSDAGLGRADGQPDLAGRQGVGVVQADDHVGPAEALVEVIGEHGPGPVHRLLRRLADEDQGPMPSRTIGGERAGDTDEDGRVHIVAAGVHHAHLLA